MFRILDRYVIREIIGPFFVSLIVSTFVLVVPTILKQAEELLAIGVQWSVVVQAMLRLLPATLSLTIPISLLLGILVGFGRLSADREFVAMQACGVTLMRLLRPVALLAVVATAATAYETIIALPNANQSFRALKSAYVASNIERNVRPGVFYESIPNLVLYAAEVPATGGWRHVLLVDKSSPGRTTVHTAKEGRVHLDRQKQTVEVQLTEDIEHTRYADKPDEHQTSRVDYSVLKIDPQWVFPPEPDRGDREMTLAELKAQIEQARKNKMPDTRFRLTYHNKLAIPLSCPVLALIGLALGASNRRDGRLASFVIGFGVIFAYYILMYSFEALVKSGRFNPELSAWMPNILMGIVGIVLLTWRARSADQPIRISLPALWRRRPSESDQAAAPASSAPPKGRVVLVIRVPHFRMPMPRLLDLYVARQYWRIIGLAFVALLGIFYISTFIDVADNLFNGNATSSTMMWYFIFQTPQYVFYVLPMSVLVATLVTIAIMTRNSELIVMRACGISLYRTALPLVLFGIAVGGTLFLLQERVLPSTNRETDRLNRIIRGLPPQTSPYNQRWIVSRTGDFYHYDLFDERANRFTNLWIYDVAPDEWRLQAITFAPQAGLAVNDEGDLARADESGGEDLLARWTLRDGWTREFPSPLAGRAPRQKPPAGQEPVKYEPFAAKTLGMEPPDYYANRIFDTDQMTYDQMLSYSDLQQFIEQRRASGADVGRYVVALKRKVAFPFVTVIMTMLAVPFAAATGRRGAVYGIGAGIVFAISYFLTMSVFGALGEGGAMSADIAAWAPNIIFSAAALYLVLTVRT
jgi:LPS export ABC transporter permease LptF